jgi:hypothetical protein
MDDPKRIRRPFKKPEGRRGYCGGLHDAGALPKQAVGAAPKTRDTVSASVGHQTGMENPE